MGISQGKVSSLVRGELHGISEAKLQDYLNLLRQSPKAKKPKAKARKHDQKEFAYA